MKAESILLNSGDFVGKKLKESWKATNLVVSQLIRQNQGEAQLTRGLLLSKQTLQIGLRNYPYKKY